VKVTKKDINTTAETLELAADYINTFGLHKGDWYADSIRHDHLDENLSCPACIGGAIARVVGVDPEVEAIESLSAFRAVAANVGRCGAVAAWNDATKRSRRQVVEKLCDTAAKVRTGEIDLSAFRASE